VTKVTAAYEFAAGRHAGQLRKSGDPVITHPLHAAQTIASLQLDTDAIAASIILQAYLDHERFAGGRLSLPDDQLGQRR